jgi:aspartyl/glutamyl-tRNA(Asn/Gln) amidotransferase C subunit
MPNSISFADVQKVANLSRISGHLSEDELSKYQQNLASILGYADELLAIDVSNYSPHSAIASTTIQDLRADEPNNNNPDYARVRDNILSNFPSRKGAMLELPIRIVEES